MAEEDFQRLLDAMPRIAEAVKELPEDLKTRGFDELIGAFHGVPAQRTSRSSVDPGAPPNDERTPVTAGSEPTNDTSGNGRKNVPAKPKATAGKARPKQLTATKDVNFWPEGNKFPDLVAAKQPGTNHERNLLAVYWFEHAGFVPVGVGEVLAAYQAAKWRPAADPNLSLRVTASKPRWLDTSNMKEIKTTLAGRVHVEHDMPAPTDEAKKK